MVAEWDHMGRTGFLGAWEAHITTENCKEKPGNGECIVRTNECPPAL